MVTSVEARPITLTVGAGITIDSAAPLARPQSLAPPDVAGGDTPPAALAVIEPGLVHIEVDPDATYVAGHLDARATAKAASILNYLRERGVLVTAAAEEILLVIARPIAPALLARTEANAALLRAALACPQCQRRHSLSPPYGWCWPCRDAATHDGPGAFGKPVADTTPATDRDTQDDS